MMTKTTMMMLAVAALGALASAGAQARQSSGGPNSQSQAYFVCGNGPCTDTYGAAYGPTPIDDIKLGGGYWDVTWSTTQPATSPFVLSTTTAKPGQPLTGIDAANALDAFYDRIPRPTGYCCNDVGEQAITAFGPGGPGVYLGPNSLSYAADVASPYPGYGATAEYVGHLGNQIGWIGPGANSAGEYTIWTPVAAPTHVPELDATGLGGAAAMLAFGIALLRGRRRAVAGAALVGALSVGGAQAQVLMCGASACADPFASGFGGMWEWARVRHRRHRH